MRRSVSCCAFFTAIIFAGSALVSAVRAEDASLGSLRAEIDELRKRIDPTDSALHHDVDIRVESALDQAFEVQTRGATLRIGGLLQVWAYSIQNDHLGMLNVPAVVPGVGRGIGNEQPSRVRRFVARAPRGVAY